MSSSRRILCMYVTLSFIYAVRGIIPSPMYVVLRERYIALYSVLFFKRLLKTYNIYVTYRVHLSRLNHYGMLRNITTINAGILRAYYGVHYTILCHYYYENRIRVYIYYGRTWYVHLSGVILQSHYTSIITKK